MAFDFSKIKPRKSEIFLYKCERCGSLKEYLIELPERLLIHDEPYYDPCCGKLVFQEKYEDVRI